MKICARSKDGQWRVQQDFEIDAGVYRYTLQQYRESWRWWIFRGGSRWEYKADTTLPAVRDAWVQHFGMVEDPI